MQEKQKADFSARIIGTGLMYDKEITKIIVDLYWTALKDLELGDIEKALQLHMRNTDIGRFMPKPADLRGYICRPAKTALIAWSQVERAMPLHGSYGTVQFEDGTINAVIRDMGGWPWICVQDQDEPWTQKEFERRYQTYRAQGIELHEPLIGVYEQNNRAGGFLGYVPETVLITESGETKFLPPQTGPKELPEHKKVVLMLAEKLSMKK
jgi:hypothetical protein